MAEHPNATLIRKGYAAFAAGDMATERSGGSLSIEIETVVADDQHVVVLSHHAASHGGRTLDAHEIDVHAIRGGRVAEARSTSFEP